MIALDTNLLARFYCDDPNDQEAARQRPAVWPLFERKPALFVPVTVVLELEWVMRGFYRLSPEDFARAMRHLLGLSSVTVEDWEGVERALQLHLEGLDFAAALHWSRSAHGRFVASFDDRGFARRIKRLALHPAVCCA